jgi:hypothetical protein
LLKGDDFSKPINIFSFKTISDYFGVSLAPNAIKAMFPEQAGKQMKIFEVHPQAGPKK